LIFSAHGAARRAEEAAQRGLRVFDATCPLVTKVHMEVIRHRNNGTECILIGHSGHPEVEGTLGQAETGMYLVESIEDVARLHVTDEENLSYVTQTTLSMDDTARIVSALRARFPNIKGPKKDDICYATQNRQDAVKVLAKNVDVMLVVGSSNSSNSNRLREVAEGQGVRGYMIDGPQDIQREWLTGVHKVGLTAGASAPEQLVQQVVRRLQEWGAEIVHEQQGKTENVSSRAGATKVNDISEPTLPYQESRITCQSILSMSPWLSQPVKRYWLIPDFIPADDSESAIVL
jgi:4-hydroxy-3-methylbut-2-enyl diphosphate reductase